MHNATTEVQPLAFLMFSNLADLPFFTPKYTKASNVHTLDSTSMKSKGMFLFSCHLLDKDLKETTMS